VIEERIENAPSQQYVWSPIFIDCMVVRFRGSELGDWHYPTEDANFNASALVDAGGTVIERYTYTPFGVVSYYSPAWTAHAGSDYEWEYLHQGGRLDGASGLYTFRFRDYSPSLGRWMTNDKTYYDSINLYILAFNNPLYFVDPFGLQATELKKVDGSVKMNGVDVKVDIYLAEVKEGEFTDGKKQYDAVYEVAKTHTNCAGFALGAGGSWRPTVTKKPASIMKAIKAMGYECKNDVSALDCKSHCDCAEWVMIYVYSKKDKDIKDIKKLYEKKDFLNDPWSDFSEENVDYHGLRGTGDHYEYQPHLDLKENQKLKTFTPTKDNPDYFEKQQLLVKMCCCRGKKNKPVEKK
jgi:RHS repeat-associated protein